MLLEQLLDLWHVRATVDAVDDPLVDDEHERRNVLDGEFLEQARMFVGVDALDPQSVALLARDVREQALHAPCGA
jgi:hypothetical protein